MCALLCGEYLGEFETILDMIGSNANGDLTQIILVFGTYFPQSNPF